MRNLKKALALVLALMMTLSLMVTASAADYADSGDVTKNEAVDVMSAINVFQGTDGGNFDPKGELTRAQAAKIISYMKLGADGAETLPKDESPFGDVKADRWYTGYVAYAKAEGIINGRSEEVFDPNGKVTGYEFGKMVLEAAGIKGEYSGTSAWAINISINLRKENADGTTLLDGIKDIVLSSNITREQACQMAFNGLIYTPAGAATGKWEVVYHANYTGTKVPDGLTFNTFDAAVAAVKAVNSSATYGTADANGYTVRAETDMSGSLAANVFQLSKASGKDAFGAPARVWSVTGKGEVARVASAASKSYTGATKGTDIAKDLNLTATAVDATVYTDGKAAGSSVKLNTVNVGGNGTKVDVYVTGTNAMDIIVTNTYVGTIKANSYKAADASKNVKEQVAITVDGTVKPASVSPTDIVFETSKFTKEDEGKVVLYTAAYDRTADNNSYKIVDADFPGEVTGTVTRSNQTNFVMGGTTYNYGAKALIDNTDVNALVTAKTEVTFYTDKAGNVMGTKNVETKSEDVYALLVDTALVSTNGWNKEVRAKLLGLDGKTTEVVITKLIFDVDNDLTNNVTDTVNSGNEEKTLYTGNTLETVLTNLHGDFVKVVEDGDATKVKLYYGVNGVAVNTDGTGSTATSGASAQITRNTPSLVANTEGFTGVIANAKTVFLYEDAQHNVTVYTGINSVPTAKFVGNTARAVVKSGVAVAVYVNAPALVADSTDSSDVVYVAVKSFDTATSADKGETTVYNAVVNGEITTIEVKDAALKVGGSAINNASAEDQLLSAVSKDPNTGLITNSTALSTGLIAQNSGYTKVADGVITINGTAYAYDDNTKVYLVDGNGVITAGAISDLKAAGDGNDKIIGYTVKGLVAALFVTPVEDPTAGDATLTLDKSTATLTTVGGTTTVAATFTANNSGRTVSSWAWTTADSSKVTVSNDTTATVTATAAAEGSSVLTVTATLDNGATLTATCTVTVEVKTPASVSLDKSTATIANGGTATLTATYNKGDTDLTVKSYAWASATTATATVGGSTTNTETVTWAAAGTTTVTVTVTLSDDSTVTAQCEVTCES